MFETMLRSGVPPHIGQSPVPGSEAARRAGLALTTSARARARSESAFVHVSAINTNCAWGPIPTRRAPDSMSQAAVTPTRLAS